MGFVSSPITRGWTHNYFYTHVFHQIYTLCRLTAGTWSHDGTWKMVFPFQNKVTF